MLVKSDPRFPDTPGRQIPLGRGLFALVSPGWYEYLNQWKWYAKKSFYCWYAVRKVTENGKARLVRMHRVVANTPGDQICHHINKYTLDNRSANLQNMSWYDHSKLYSWR